MEPAFVAAALIAVLVVAFVVIRRRGARSEPAGPPAGPPAATAGPARPPAAAAAPSPARLPLHVRFRRMFRATPDPGEVERRIRIDADVLRDIQDGLAEIPPLPLVVSRLIEELQDPESSARSVAEVAGSDPVLAANLLRAINASFHGLAREVTDVQQAIALLGFDTVQTLVMQFGLSKVFETGQQGGYDTEDLWVHSLSVGLVATTLARRCQDVDQGFVSTLGLLHDIGKLAINSKFPDRARQIEGTGSAEESQLKREERLFGADHAYIGAYIARQWKLPDVLVQAIQWHHLPRYTPLDRFEERVQRGLMVIHIANQIAKYCHIYSEDMEIDLVPDAFYERLGLPVGLEENIDTEVKQAINRGIFFVDQITDRPLRAVGRMLRTRTARELAADDLPQIVARAAGIERVRIEDVGPAETALGEPMESLDLDRDKPTRRRDSGVGAGDFLLEGTLDEATVRRLLDAFRTALGRTDLDKEIRFPLGFLAKFVLSNALLMAEPGQRVAVRLLVASEAATLVFDSPALAFRKVADVDGIAARHGESYARTLCRALLAAGLGNVLTLEWVDEVIAESDGTRLLFRRLRRR